MAAFNIKYKYPLYPSQDPPATRQICNHCKMCHAKQFCTHCQEYYCKQCIDYHRTLTLTKGHEMLNSLEMNEKISRSLASLEEKARSLSKDVEKNLRRVDDNYNKQISELTAFKLAVNKFLDKKVGELRDKMTSLKKQNEDVLQTSTKICENFTEDIKKKKHLVETLRSSGADMFKEFEKLYSEVKELEENIHKCRTEIRINTYDFRFKRGRVYSNLLSEKNPFGSVETVPFSHPISRSIRHVRKEKKADMFVKHPDEEKECWITGMTIEYPNILLVTDNINSSVKRIDTITRSITGHRELSSEPWDITLMGLGFAALTLPKKEQVKVISTSGNLASAATFKTRGQCFGIEATFDQLFVSYEGSDKNPGKIEILDHFGQVLSEIKCYGTFRHPKYISLNHKGVYPEIYVCDAINSTVNKLSKTQCYEIYQHLENVPEGLTYTEDGYILICIKEFEKILLVNDKGDKVETFLTRSDGIKNAQCVCYDAEQKIIYVSCDDESYIHVYNLK